MVFLLPFLHSPLLVNFKKLLTGNTNFICACFFGFLKMRTLIRSATRMRMSRVSALSSADGRGVVLYYRVRQML